MNWWIETLLFHMHQQKGLLPQASALLPGAARSLRVRSFCDFAAQNITGCDKQACSMRWIHHHASHLIPWFWVHHGAYLDWFVYDAPGLHCSEGRLPHQKLPKPWLTHGSPELEDPPAWPQVQLVLHHLLQMMQAPRLSCVGTPLCKSHGLAWDSFASLLEVQQLARSPWMLQSLGVDIYYTNGLTI